MGILLPKLEFCYAFACLSTCLPDRRRSVYWRPSKICCGRWRMAQGQTSESVTPARLVIHNIGLLLSGDIGNPILDADTVFAVNGKIAAAGVSMLGEVGLGSVKDGATARQMVAWARKYGIQSTIHTGGPSIPGSSLIDKDIVLAADADVIGHINGGHTALPDDQIVALCEKSPRALEIVHNGNEKAALLTLRTAKELKHLDRVILGTDSPAASGVQPLGILPMISILSSLPDVRPEVPASFPPATTP